MQVKGVISFLPVRRPTIEEIEQCEWIELISSEEWDPKFHTLEEQEQPYHDQQYPINPSDRMMYPIVTSSTQSSHLSQMPAELMVSVSSAQSSIRKPSLDATTLAKRWGIGLKTAERTLNVTTQLAIRQAIHPIQRRFCTEVMQLRYPRLGGRHGRFYTDTFFSKTPSLAGCSMAQIYVNDVHFTKVFPLENQIRSS